MSLWKTLQKRGYPIRQHLEEAGWTERKLTVVDLDEAQRSALERGGIDGLRAVLDQQGRWTFPALDVETPLPVRRHLVLGRASVPAAVMAAPRSAPHLYRMAQELSGVLNQRFGLDLPLLDDAEAGLELLQSQDVLLFGGAHENRLGMDVALRYQTGFVDATIPGDGGWVATVHAGLDASGHHICQVAASASCSGEALTCLVENLAAEGDRVVLRHMHCIAPGPEMQAHFPPWESFIDDMPGRIPRFQGQSVRAPRDLDALADLLGQGLDSGGPDVNFYNAAPIDIANSCALYYQRSADPRALYLFRALMFRLADYYLKTPEGASYPADLDFRIGTLILYYARLEHDPIFSEEDRLILANLLLSCARSIYEYAVKHWPIEPDAPTRHNHETFPGRSLLFAADYFERYGIPDVKAWRAHADATFSGGMWHRFKQRENANHYEHAAFEHGASFSAFTGRRFDMFAPECLRMAALRQVVTTDNLLRPVDYGDASISMDPRGADTLAVLATAQQEDPVLRWFAQACFNRRPTYVSPALECIRRPYSGPAPEAGVWEFLPLDAHFRDQFCPGFPPDRAFDKLAFRTGWTDDAQYLLFEGVGNQDISHSHNELNSIVRLNHLGRHWVVSNGYGRRAGLTNVSQSFSTRIRGPEDHNMLVLRQGEEIIRKLPRCNALLQKGQIGDLAYATGALLNYAGTNWRRTLLIAANRFVLVIDRVHAVRPEFETAHIEWNCLGRATPRERGFRLEQQGVFMDVDSDSGWAAHVALADQSADWKSVLESGRYPYASFPLTKLVFQMPAVKAGEVYCLTTLLAASRAPAPVYRVREPALGRVSIDGPHGMPADLRLDDQDLSVRADGASLDIRFDP